MEQGPAETGGNGGLATYLRQAENNARASVRSFKGEMALLERIDRDLDALTDRANNHPYWFAGLFGIRAHASFRAAVRLAASGCMPETFQCLRCAIEFAVYGHYVADDEPSQEIWLRRHDDQAAKKKVRSLFTFSRTLRKLEEADRVLAGKVQALYDEAIDFGAHPNEKALSGTTKLRTTASGVEFEVHHLQKDPETLQWTLRRALEAGNAIGEVLQLTLPDPDQE